MRGPGVQWEPTKCSRVCSKHFQSKDFDRTSQLKVRLWHGAVPSIAVPYPPSPNDDDNDGRATAPQPPPTGSHKRLHCNTDDTPLSSEESTDSVDEGMAEESESSPASPTASFTEVTRLPQICAVISVMDGVGEYCINTGASTASWDKYIERLEEFCTSTNISEDKDKHTVLLGCCGETTRKLITRLVEPDKPATASYETIKRVVRDHLRGKPSLLRARFHFFGRNQGSCESVTDYATALRKLAEDCGFGGRELPMDVMMRDRFVCGIRDEDLREHLLAKDDLTFDSAYDMALKAEAPREQLLETVWLTWNDKNNRDAASLVYTSKSKQQIILPSVVVAGTDKAQAKLSWHALTSNEKGVLLVKPVSTTYGS